MSIFEWDIAIFYGNGHARALRSIKRPQTSKSNYIHTGVTEELQNCLESQKRTIIHIEQDDALSDQQHESHMIIPRMKARLESRKGCGYFESERE